MIFAAGYSARLVVISLHAALVVMLTTWHERMPGDEGTEAIIVDLSPVAAPPTDSRNDLAPGPEQQQSKSTRDVQQPEQTRGKKSSRHLPCRMRKSNCPRR